MKSWTLPLLLAMAALPSIAHADQCQLIDDEVANRALAALKGHPKVIQFCEPCGDKAPGEPIVADRVAKTRGTTADYEITIDRREVDLAYTYVQTGPSRFENVAALSGCPTSGVSPSLRVDDSTPSAVMIQADPTPVTHVQLPASEPAPQPPEVTYIVQVKTEPTNWLLILAACAAMTGLWTLAAIIFLRRRRVAEMKPRAVNLVDRSKHL
jgi:hypothetical protein